jgi:transforming growth factor-beta-induced protein
MERNGIFYISVVLIAVSILCAGCATQNPGTVTPTPVPAATTEITAIPTTELTAAPLTTEITAAQTTIVITVAPTPRATGMNIVETLEADGRFTTMVTLLKAAQLDGNLSGPGPFTVFAPTDDAFKKLPDGTVDSLLKDPQGYYLNKMLLYHVVNGKLMTADLMRTGSLNTLAGKPILIDTSNGVVFVNGNAKVISSDVACSNGVIQAIDTVLNPPQ